MTVKKLIEKYKQMLKDKYETVYIQQVLQDLRNCQKPK